MPNEAREVEFEVVGKGEDLPGRGDDPFVAFVSRLMDNAFSIPGTNIRFGLDPLIGLLPGLGDTATALVSVLLVLQSARRGVPKIVLARMALNILLNTGIGAVPIVGDLFSMWFKSNAMNYALLRKHGGLRTNSTFLDWMFVAGLLVLLLTVVTLLLVGAITVIARMWNRPS
jgi:Domain of unknown function (DUF4112)